MWNVRIQKYVPMAGFFGLQWSNVFNFTHKARATRYVKYFYSIQTLGVRPLNYISKVTKYFWLTKYYSNFSQGDLLIMNARTAEPYCGCDPLLLRQYYFPPLRLCYEHHTRGPCESGLLFAYNHTADLTHCLCSESLANFHLESQQCFQFGTKGPCRKGQVGC